MASRRYLGGVAALLIVGTRAFAQQADSLPREAPGAPGACLRVAPAMGPKRVSVYLTAKVDSAAHAPIMAGVATLLDGVAMRIRRGLGARDEALPRGDSTVTSARLRPELLVTAYRDGRVAWPATPAATSRSAELLAVALGEMQRDGALQLAWPADLARDSVRVRLRFVWPELDGTGAFFPFKATPALPVFSMNVYVETPPIPLAPPRVTFPSEALRLGIGGTVRVSYRVLEDGSADSTSVRHAWPRTVPPPTGEAAAHYASLMRAIREGLRFARFRPATFDGCAISFEVLQPFEFRAL